MFSSTSNFNQYGSREIQKRYMPLKRGYPRCYGTNEQILSSMFHSIYAKGDCFEIKFKNINRKPDYSSIKPNLKNICYSDSNWNISYNNENLIYAVKSSLAAKINANMKNRFFLHLYKKGESKFLNKDFPVNFMNDGSLSWTVRNVNLEPFDRIETGIFNEKGRLFDLSFNLDNCKYLD